MIKQPLLTAKLVRFRWCTTSKGVGTIILLLIVFVVLSFCELLLLPPTTQKQDDSTRRALVSEERQSIKALKRNNNYGAIYNEYIANQEDSSSFLADNQDAEMQRIAQQIDSIIYRTYRGLKSKGHTPGSERFNQLFRSKALHRMDRLRDGFVLHTTSSRNLSKWRRRRKQGTVNNRLMGRINKLGNRLIANEDNVKTQIRQVLKDTENKWIRSNNYNGRTEKEIDALKASEEMENKINSDWAALEETEDGEDKDEINPLYCTLSSDCYFADEKVEPLTICDRPTDVGSVEDFASLQTHAKCAEITQDRPIIILQGGSKYGRSGNNVLEFLHAIQLARDQGVQLGIMAGSWAMNILQKMWMAIDDSNWQEKFEKAFCVKIFNFPYELKGWDIIPPHSTKELYFYKSPKPLGEYIDDQEYTIRALFRDYNEGGLDSNTRDMCSGIKSVFGDDRAGAIYSVIHSRILEGPPGLKFLAKMARKSGCDPVAALEMRPDYVKSILKPLGMLNYPIIVVTDSQDPDVVTRLLQDPELGPQIRLIHEDSRWIGGDITVAVMANVFIGNPASSFSSFINKARSSLGFGHSYLWRARDPETDEWRTVCGDHCVFDKTIYGHNA